MGNGSINWYPVEQLGCVQSLLPLHSAVAVARLNSCLEYEFEELLSFITRFCIGVQSITMNSSNAEFHKRKVVFLTGSTSTGTGKSRLSIDIATRFPADTISSDKMQVYKGLDIVTNKMPNTEGQGVPHISWERSSLTPTSRPMIFVTI